MSPNPERVRDWNLLNHTRARTPNRQEWRGEQAWAGRGEEGESGGVMVMDGRSGCVGLRVVWGVVRSRWAESVKGVHE